MSRKDRPHLAKSFALAPLTVIRGEAIITSVGAIQRSRQCPGQYEVLVGIRQWTTTRRLWIPLSYTPYLVLGSRWVDGVYSGLVPGPLASADTGARPEAGTRSYQELRGYPGLPRSLRPVPLDQAIDDLQVFRTASGGTVLVPTWVIFQFFFAFSPRVALSAFLGPHDALLAAGADPMLLPYSVPRTAWKDPEAGVARVYRRRDVSNDEAARIARVVFSEAGQRGQALLARQASRTLVQGNADKPFALPQLPIPSSGTVSWQGHGVQLESDWIDGTAVLLWARHVDTPTPFNELYIDAENSNDPGSDTVTDGQKPRRPPRREPLRPDDDVLMIGIDGAIDGIARIEVGPLATTDIGAATVPRRREPADRGHAKRGVGPPPEHPTPLHGGHGPATGLSPGVPTSPRSDSAVPTHEGDALAAAKLEILRRVARELCTRHGEAACSLRESLIVEPSKTERRRKATRFAALIARLAAGDIVAIELISTTPSERTPILVVHRADGERLTDEALYLVIQGAVEARRRGFSIRRALDWAYHVTGPSIPVSIEAISHSPGRGDAMVSATADRLLRALISFGMGGDGAMTG